MERTETQSKILEVGKKEFLEKGFKDASLNKIVAEAGFTKGAFYGYYPDKTALFEDLVGETASELLTRFKAAQDDYFDLVPEGRAKDSLELSTQHLHEFVTFMYDHFDEFKLILCRAEGTGIRGFHRGAGESGGRSIRRILRPPQKKRYALREHDPSASSHDHKSLLYGGV